MLSGDIHSEESRRETLLRDIKRGKLFGFDIKDETTVRIFLSVGDNKSAMISCLFKHLIDFPETPVRVEFYTVSFQQPPIVTVVAADMMHSDKRMAAVTHPSLCLSSNIVLKALLTALKARDLPFDYELYCNHLHVQVASILHLKKIKPDLHICNIANVCSYNVGTLYSFNQDEVMLEDNIRVILPLLALGANFGLNVLIDTFTRPKVKSLIKKVDIELNVLHLFVKNCMNDNTSITMTNQLLSLLDHQPHSLIDNEGNSLLHVCNTERVLSLLLPYVEDVNSVNAEGNTALHEAALKGNLDKYMFLCAHGADVKKTNRDGKKAIELVEKTNSPFSAFAECHRHGVALLYPPNVAAQFGQTCGIYAVATSTAYHWSTKTGLFKKPPYPARKCDVQDEINYSLRQHAKAEQETFAGEMFSVKGMEKLVEVNGCRSFTSRPASLATFLETITASLSEDFPLMIPYSKDIYNSNKPQAFEAHWSTIIGVYTDNETKKSFVLLAHYGSYELIDANSLYKGFALMEETFPLSYLYKTDAKEWVKSRTEPHTRPKGFFELRERDLRNDFMGQLITVMPPGK